MKLEKVMISPEEVRSHFQKHFSEVTPEEFLENVKSYSPEILEDHVMNEKQGVQNEKGQLILFPFQPQEFPLEAYLACALTGLTEEQKQYMFQLSDVIQTICSTHDINLYEPRKKTDPVHHPDVSDAEVFRIDRERVLKSDLVIHLCHYPSTGAGEELEIAHNALIPIILISHESTRVSRMITGIPSFKIHIMYNEPEEMRQELHNQLLQIRPILEERKLAFSEYALNTVGEKIRTRREELGLTREEVANSQKHVTLEALQQIEDSVDHISNPTLIQLRTIATILKTTVADLVEPNLHTRFLATLSEWMGEERASARFIGLSTRDRNKLIRRMLLRIIDSLEEE